MSINQIDYTRLLDDIKLISRSVKIMCEEDNYEKRKYDFILSEDLINRLYEDIKEISE